MGKGGRGSGGSRYRYIPGFSWIFGPCPDTMNNLRYIAIARGLRNVDELLLCLGKKSHEISLQNSLDMLEKEAGHDVYLHMFLSQRYKAGKGYGPCNRLLEAYLKDMKDNSMSPGSPDIRLDDLKKYCSYTDDELRSLDCSRIMGKGGRGSGGSMYRYIPGFEAGFSWIFGPCRDTMNNLRYVAIARGLRNVDELLVCLGKKSHEISLQNSLDMLEKEAGHDVYVHVFLSKQYKAGKGYGPCNRLLEAYLKDMKNKSVSLGSSDIQLDDLKKYCSYTDDELRSLA